MYLSVSIKQCNNEPLYHNTVCMYVRMSVCTVRMSALSMSVYVLPTAIAVD